MRSVVAAIVVREFRDAHQVDDRESLSRSHTTQRFDPGLLSLSATDEPGRDRKTCV